LNYSRPSAVPGTELLIARGSSSLWRLFHERYLVCGCTSVATEWVYRGKASFVYDGGIGLMEPGETHYTTASHKPSDFKALFIDPEFFVNFSAEQGMSGTPHFRLAQVMDSRLFAALYRFCASAEAGGTPLEQQSLLADCVQHLLVHTEHKPPALRESNLHGPLRRARVYLQERFNESVNLDELSAAAGLSRFHLVRTFAKYFGLPPHAYQIHVRIERARILLRQGVSAAEAASSVGFADQSHFTRHFKKVLRITPSSYARSMGLHCSYSLPSDPQNS
jgi:AraC-like DNA-binding protein